jgi:peptide/nickel transport system permease protein
MLRRFLIKRLALALPLLLGITVLTFGILHLAPGGPTMAESAFNPRVSPDSLREMRQIYGLDKPLHVQYWDWVKRIAVLDLGNSFKDHRPVRDRVFQALPATLLLSGFSFLLAYGVGLPMGIYNALHAGRRRDRFSTLLSFAAFSVPTFVLALFLQLLLGSKLGLLPISGFRSPWSDAWPWWQQSLDVLWHLAMPLAVTAFGSWVATAQYMRNSLIETLQQDYVRFARAKGLSERRVIFNHALPNALLPMITLLGLQLPGLIGGSFIIESLFAWPGMGCLGYEAAINYDYPVVMGVALMGSALTVLGNILADAGYAWIDPRVRL